MDRRTKLLGRFKIVNNLRSPSLSKVVNGMKVFIPRSCRSVRVSRDFLFGEGKRTATTAGVFGNGRISRMQIFYLTETEVETQIAIDRDSNKEVGWDSTFNWICPGQIVNDGLRQGMLSPLRIERKKELAEGTKSFLFLGQQRNSYIQLLLCLPLPMVF